ncbi:hypothetical protein [Paenarthrobacter ureafaciens]|uniref:aromatic-ring hydroxylase C-terminal domain-containing protein n=1 Tax=Paenarthrobacter ureafaciens TaxID=37931 RepID=UPI003463A6E1
MDPVVSDANIDLGYRYRSTAVITDGDDHGEVQGDPRESGGRAGTRAPHHAIGGKEGRISTLDLFGRNFVLLTGPDQPLWRDRARRAEEELNIQIDVHSIGDTGDYSDTAGGFSDAYGISAAGAVLIRPDGFVAWRAATDAHTAPSLTAVLTTLLGHSTRPRTPDAEAFSQPLPV